MSANIRTTRLVVVAGAIEMFTGISIYAFPQEFPPTYYASLIPWFPYLSAGLLGAGLCLALTLCFPLPRWARRLLGVLAAIPLVIMAQAVVRVGGYSGATSYAFLTLAVVAAPWLSPGPQSESGPGPSLFALTLGGIHGVVGFLMTAVPWVFRSPAFTPIRPQLPAIGVMSLICAGVLIWTGLRPTDEPRWRRLQIAAGVLLPLVLIGTFWRTAAWTGVSMWSMWFLAALLNDRDAFRKPSAAPEIDPVDASLISEAQRSIETGTWLVTLLVVVMAAVGATVNVALPLRAGLFVLAMSVYNTLLYWASPRIGTLRCHVGVHLSVTTVLLGLLVSDPASMAHALLLLMLGLPMLGAWALGLRAGMQLLALGTVMLIIGGLDRWLLGGRELAPALTEALLQALVLAVVGALEVKETANRRQISLDLRRARADLTRQVAQLSLVDQIGRSVRSSLDVGPVLSTTARELGAALGADRCIIQLTKDGNLPAEGYTYVAPGAEAAAPARWDMDGLLALVAMQPQSVAVDDATAARAGARSAMVVPVSGDEGLLGIIVFHMCKAPRLWSRQEQEFVESVAVQVAVAIAHARTHETLRIRHHELQVAHGELQSRDEELTAQAEELMAHHEALLQSSIALRDSEGRFRTAFRDAPVGMALVTLDGEILQVNQAICGMLGYSEQELIEQHIIAVSHPDDLRHLRGSVDAIKAGHLDSYARERRYRHRDGHLVWAQLHSSVVRSGGGEPQYLITHVLDITERKRAEEQLLELANFDPLTGLLNRRRFQEELEHALAGGGMGALLFLDADQFKFINDSLGHRAGDDLLRGLAQLLKGCLGDGDTIARLGGDEFAILLPHGDRGDALLLGDGILKAVRNHTALIAEQPVGITVSIGISLYPEHGRSAEDLLSRADLAMYQAKEEGRNSARVYAPGSGRQAQMEGRLNWERRIREALEQDRFVLHYQPIVDLGTGAVEQHEVLLRMQAEDGSLILPGAFLDVAESYGLICHIDRWVVRRAIRLIAEQKQLGRELCLEVNLSGKAFADVELLPLIEGELKATGIDPAALVLEITETAAIADTARARHFMETLKASGCRFALDDFGAGFSSFHYLRHLPIDYVKIDGSYIEHLPDAAADVDLVRAMVGVARELGKKTIAEWVSNAESMTLLREIGVDCGQGFFIGRPGPEFEQAERPGPEFEQPERPGPEFK